MAAPTADARKRDVAALLRRLRRIEGQVRGLQRMVEEERYCIDILQQLMAARAALDQVGLTLLEDHLRGCVAHAIRTGEGEASIDEMMEVVRQFLG